MAKSILNQCIARSAFTGWRAFLCLLVLSKHSRKDPFMGKMEKQ